MVMINNLTATELAEMARKSSSWHEYQTACRLELERREYFNGSASIPIDKVTVKREKPAIGYYIAAVIILVGGVYGIVWAIVQLVRFIGGLI